MNSSIKTTHIDSLDTIANMSLPEVTWDNLQGGYVEFSFLDQTYSHFFTCRQDLDVLRTYIQEGKPLEGLRAYIREWYAPRVLGVCLQEKVPVIIWNYELVGII